MWDIIGMIIIIIMTDHKGNWQRHTRTRNKKKKKQVQEQWLVRMKG